MFKLNTSSSVASQMLFVHPQILSSRFLYFMFFNLTIPNEFSTIKCNLNPQQFKPNLLTQFRYATGESIRCKADHVHVRVQISFSLQVKKSHLHANPTFLGDFNGKYGKYMFHGRAATIFPILQ